MLFSVRSPDVSDYWILAMRATSLYHVCNDAAWAVWTVTANAGQTVLTYNPHFIENLYKTEYVSELGMIICMDLNCECGDNSW